MGVIDLLLEQQNTRRSGLDEYKLAENKPVCRLHSAYGRNAGYMQAACICNVNPA